MYGPAPPPATAPPARESNPTEILKKSKVTLGWILWYVAREQICPRDAAWALCPDVEPMFSGLLKLIGHSELVLTRWRAFYRECGFDAGQEAAVKKELLDIWGRKEEVCCHQLHRK